MAQVTTMASLTAEQLPTPDTPRLLAAQTYIAQGLVVVPCLGDNGKKATPKWQGLNTTTEANAAAWWPEGGRANTGLLMGPHGLLALDVDGDEGEAELAAAEAALGPLPPTLENITGRGRHLVYRLPAALTDKQVAKLTKSAAGMKLCDGRLVPNKGKGFDLRAGDRDAGRSYIIVAPSVHAETGKRYWWKGGPVAELPAAWVAALPRQGSPAPSLPDQRSLRLLSHGARETDRNRAIYERALRDGCDEIAAAPDGTRNATLSRNALRLARLALRAGLPADAPCDELAAAAEIAGLTSRETRDTLKSALAHAEREGPAPPPVDRPRPEPLVREREQTRAPAPATTTALSDDLTRHTDIGLAARFAADHADALRYCHEQGWLRWDSGRWTRDDLYPVQLAKQTARALATEAAATAPPRDAPRLVGTLLASRAVAAMVSLSQSELAVRTAALDADPAVLNVSNGTIDLLTGRLRPHRAADLLTKQSPVVYDPAAVCPQWAAFLARVLPDEAVRAFVQRLAGYALLGDVRDHVLPVFWGTGANGKSTYLEAVQYVMGDYARTIPSSVLLVDRNDKHPTERAQLAGLRLAVANETNAGRALDEGTVKQLTGGDRITARFMRQDFFEFVPSHKLILCSNHKPQITGTDEGTWRRVLLVPWEVCIPVAERDTGLPTRLRAEAPGILRWCLEGCAAYLRDGLSPPPAVTAATTSYRLDSDILGQFLAECCTENPALHTPAANLYRAYVAWAESSNVAAVTRDAFGSAMSERGKFTRAKVGGVMRYRGIALLAVPRSHGDEPDAADDYH